MSKWQPIETALKDGTQILASNGNECVVVEYKRKKDGTAYWEIAHRIEGDRLISLFCTMELTHWQPLPPPPKDTTNTLKNKGISQ